MDKKIISWWSAHRPTKRRLVQLYAALLYNAHIKGFIKGEIYTGPFKNLCVPGLNCYSCPGAVGACPVGALQNALTSSGTRAPAYILGIVFLMGLTLGRTICGWLCPMGLIQELLYHIPTFKIPKGRITKMLSYLKYVILAVFVIIIPLAYSAKRLPMPAFCKYICPAGTLEGAMGLLAHPVNADLFSMLGVIFTRKFIILMVIVTASVFAYRAFCRFLCPLGALLGFFSGICLPGVKVEVSKCTGCGRCIRECPMDISRVGDHECIHCGKCKALCPEGAIENRFRTGVKSDKAEGSIRNKRIKGGIFWCTAIVVLAVVMLMVNRPWQSGEKSTAADEETSISQTAETRIGESTGSTGSEVGMRCPDFTVSLYGKEEGEFTVSENTGKILIINFWATWCTPCCKELPFFQSVYEKYPDDAEVIAIHSELVTDDVQSYLDEKGYTMPFGLDEDGSVIESLGGSTMLPQTVIVDRNGMIVYNSVGSVTFEELEKLIEPLL